MAGKGFDVEGELRDLEPTLRAIAWRHSGVNGLDFDDVLQVGRIGAWSALLDYRPGSRSRRRWALNRADDRMADHVARAGRGAQGLLRDARRVVVDPDGGELVDALDRVPTTAADPAVIVEKRETLARLQRRMRELPEAQRAAVLKRANGEGPGWATGRANPVSRAGLASLAEAIA